MDDTQGGPEDIVWLSYAELARRRQITRASAIRWVRRHGWQRTSGNDKLARVAVPRAFAEPAEATSEGGPNGQPQGNPKGGPGGDTALQAAVEALREANAQLADARAAAEDRAAAAEARIADLEDQLDRARATALAVHDRQAELERAEGGPQGNEPLGAGQGGVAGE